MAGSSAVVVAEIWDAVQIALENRQYSEARRLCRRILASEPQHVAALEVVEDLDDQYARAGQLYAAVARDMGAQALELSASSVQEAMNTYPDHPDGFLVQQRLLEKTANYSRNVAHGMNALAGESWPVALECFSRAAQANPDEPALTTLVSTLAELVHAVAAGRRAIDSAVQAGDFGTAMAIAASLDRHVTDVGTALKEQTLGDIT
jgi:tetratricopeptide (TPR) repeat protein